MSGIKDFSLIHLFQLDMARPLAMQHDLGTLRLTTARLDIVFFFLYGDFDLVVHSPKLVNLWQVLPQTGSQGL